MHIATILLAPIAVLLSAGLANPVAEQGEGFLAKGALSLCR
jgi:hypothetical protein